MKEIRTLLSERDGTKERAGRRSGISDVDWSAASGPVDEDGMEPAIGLHQDLKQRTTSEHGADACGERCGAEAATPSSLPRTSSYTFRRAFFRAYVEKHCANPSHLGTIIEGSCPFVQSKHAL